VAQLAPLRLTVPPLDTVRFHKVWGDELDTLPALNTMRKEVATRKRFSFTYNKLVPAGQLGTLLHCTTLAMQATKCPKRRPLSLETSATSFHARLILMLWRWSQHVTAKQRCLSTNWHGKKREQRTVWKYESSRKKSVWMLILWIKHNAQFSWNCLISMLTFCSTSGAVTFTHLKTKHNLQHI
jgi:hypothetical protein